MTQEVSFIKCESHKETFEIAEEAKNVLVKELDSAKLSTVCQSITLLEESKKDRLWTTFTSTSDGTRKVADGNFLIAQQLGQVETDETEYGNGRLKRKTETEKLKTGNGRQR